jgi:SNF2 family DNA or RNA helicase
MGLGVGKSRVAIVCAEEMGESGANRVLILAPLSVVPAWEKQFQEYATREWEVCLLNKGGVSRKAKLAKDAMKRATAFARPVVVIVNYESARGPAFADLAMHGGWDLLVCDEIHKLKSPTGTTSRWVSRLAKTIKKRLGLTGTPMPHSQMDIYGIFRTLDPTIFGWSFVRFRKRYAIMGGYGSYEIVGYQHTDELRSKMALITYQADRSVLDLPDAIHQTIEVEMGRDGRRIYTELSEHLRAEIQAGTIHCANGLVALLRLQQLTSGVATIDGDPPLVVRVDEGKRRAFADLLDALPASEPVVAFGRFHADLEAVHLAAKDAGRESLELSGRKRELEEWQDGKAPILAVQIQAGGVGIDLTHAGKKPCSYVVYLSTGFSLGDYEQSLARAHRPGAERTVFYYHLIATDTVDVQVFHALRARKDAVEAVLADLASADSLEPH